MGLKIDLGDGIWALRGQALQFRRQTRKEQVHSAFTTWKRYHVSHGHPAVPRRGHIQGECQQPGSLRTSLSGSRKPAPRSLVAERVILTFEDQLQSIIRSILTFSADGLAKPQTFVFDLDCSRLTFLVLGA